MARTAKKYDEDLSPVRTARDFQKDVLTMNISRNKLPETSSEYSLKTKDSSHFNPEGRRLFLVNPPRYVKMRVGLGNKYMRTYMIQ